MNQSEKNSGNPAISNDVVPAVRPLGLLPKLQATGVLPGKSALYAMRDGEGEFHLFGGQVATLIARSQETNGEFEAAILTGSVGAGLPLMRHKVSDRAIYVMNGRLELHLDGRIHMLTEGDYAYVPAGTPFGYRMQGWRTRFLTWTIGDKVGPMYAALGEPFSRPVQPEDPDLSLSDEKKKAAEAAADVEFLGELPSGEGAVLVTGKEIAGPKTPYVLQAGEGERLVAAEQIFSFLQTSDSTNGDFIAVMTEGPAGEAIPWHYHQHHTENFFCVEGLMTMWVNGDEVHLHPGDYMHVPAGAVHSYRLDSPYTKFFGWLVPALFEPFFRTIGDPYGPHVFPVEPPAFRFDRVLKKLDELDLNVLTVRV